jgi:hypothetical protein
MQEMGLAADKQVECQLQGEAGTTSPPFKILGMWVYIPFSALGNETDDAALRPR